jgi:hypothetical protein
MEMPDGDGSETGVGIYVTELGADDVLLGRGTGPNSNEGNVNFRIAVEAMKSDYVSTPSRKAKNKLVHKTVEAIKAKNGRFLSKLRKSEIKMLGMSAHKAVYEIMRDDVAFEKTKQAIRYVHYKKDADQGTKRTADEQAQDSRSKCSKQDGPSPGASSKNKAMKKDLCESGEKQTESSVVWDSRSIGGADRGASSNLVGSSAASTSPGGSNTQTLLSSSLAGPIGHHQMQPTTFPTTTTQLGKPSASIHHIISDTRTPNASSASPAQSAGVGGNSSLASPGAGGYPFLPSLQKMTSTLHHTGFRNSSLLAQTGGASSSSSAPHADASGATTAQSRPKSQATMPSPPATNIYSELLSQSLSGSSRAPPAQQPAAGHPAAGEYGGAQGVPSGLFQQALQNDQLRAILLSDERYRHIIESLFPNNRRS